jgi:hypothetical protein
MRRGWGQHCSAQLPGGAWHERLHGGAHPHHRRPRLVPGHSPPGCPRRNRCLTFRWQVIDLTLCLLWLPWMRPAQQVSHLSLASYCVVANKCHHLLPLLFWHNGSPSRCWLGVLQWYLRPAAYRHQLKTGLCIMQLPHKAFLQREQVRLLLYY